VGWCGPAAAHSIAPREPSRAPQREAAPPAVLSAADAQRLRRAFEAQARGDFATANREAALLSDRRLIGHLRADRYLRAADSVQIPDLQSWLADHGDHPDAPAIYALLVRRLPRGAALPPPPDVPEAEAQVLEVATEERAPSRLARHAGLDRAVRERLAEGRGEEALALIRRNARAQGAYAAQLKSEVARAMFRAGQDAEALAVAQEALRADDHPGAAFVGGLAAFSLSRYEEAMRLFETAARAELAPAALRSAAAYWTARSAVRARRPQAYVSWMLQAAQEPRTFYGLLARRSLGLPNGFAWESAEPDTAVLAETAGGWRAMALVQIGQMERAEAELRLLWRRGRGNPMLTQAIEAFAAQVGLHALAAQVAAGNGGDGRARDFTRFPLPLLRPDGGFRIDPALLYALALQESRFNPQAVSRAGARGLLQVMPATASYVANDPSLRGRGAIRLHEPGFGLEIGQRYLHYLARHDSVGGDLIRLLAAYNAGPGNLARWLPAVRHRDDPLLFIESIPLGETRAFVQRVLAYQWIYASRLGLPAPSLDALAEGRFPQFAGPEEVAAMLTGRPAWQRMRH
ncbi:MAG: transglycosylase SLT domain-containing protein, partial [Rhodovarius sp.]|nr:transglycosylase SLT domain-containing protein [Rhodovarius sp.]